MKRLILRSLYLWGISKPSGSILLTSGLGKNFVQNNRNHKCIYKNINVFKRNLSTSSLVMKKKNSSPEGKQNGEELTENDLLEDSDYNKLMAKLGGDICGVNSVAVLQPWVKWGRKKRIETDPDFLLNEACALVKSLPFTTVPYKEVIPLQEIKKSHIFGKGSLERIKSAVHTNHAQAVFVSIEHLTRVQKWNLEEQFRVPVFDRYFIVLSIFKHHASTVEARLQIAMAELPFMSKRYLLEKHRLVLDQREAKLKEALKRLENRRERARNNRKSLLLPSVAVVGYTNCGKTTLIRALTGDQKIQGENRLFATLDVTAHKGILPCGLNAVFLDSVGFIQDIPTSLIASFRATLQDTVYADVVVHVRDISHPDVVNQTITVEETLRSLPLPEGTPLVVVNNKADLVQERTEMDELLRQDGIFTSCVTGEGLNEAVERMQNEILKVTGRKRYKMRLLTGSPQIEWLKRMTGVFAEEVDEEDMQYTLIYVVMNEAEKSTFRKTFQTNQKR